MSGRDPTWAVAFAALAICAGCPPARVGELFEYMAKMDLPRRPQDAVWQMQQAVGRMLDER